VNLPLSLLKRTENLRNRTVKTKVTLPRTSHYFSDWITKIRKKGILEDITQEKIEGNPTEISNFYGSKRLTILPQMS